MLHSVSTTAAMRFGYGLRPSEARIAGPDELLAQVERGVAEVPLFPQEGIVGRREKIVRYRANTQELAARKKRGEPTDEQSRSQNRAAAANFRMDSEARIAQAVLSPNGFHERLSSFWTNHFAIAASKSPMMRLAAPMFEAEVIRPFLSGRFSDLVRTVCMHPAMLVYLDQIQSIGPNSVMGLERGKGINENFARELIELHTLGVEGGYSQNDVRQAAYVLSGLAVDLESLEVGFRPRRAEPGRFSVLGNSYGGEKRVIEDCLDLIDDLSLHPGTAKHICRKLAIHFVSDEPPQVLVDAMVAAWIDSGGHLLHVYKALLDHPAAWESPSIKIKLPFDYVVSSLRAFDVDEVVLLSASPGTGASSSAGVVMDVEPKPIQADSVVTIRTALNVLLRMGQPIWMPPSPAGFEDDSTSWMNANQLTERIGWARRLASIFGKDRDPREFAKMVLADAARDETIQIVGQAPSKVVGITLVLASPEFNRR